MGNANDSASLNFLNPETFSAGLIDDIDLIISAATVEEYDWNGKATFGNGCCIKLTLADDDGESGDHYYSIGQSEHWIPTDDGKGFQPVTGKKGISKNAAGAKLVNAMIEKGFPKNKLGNDVSVFVGYKWHWKQVAKTGPDAKDAEGRDKTVLLPVKLVSAPGEGKKGAGKGKGQTAPGTGTAAPPASASTADAAGSNSNRSGNEEVGDRTKALIMRALTEAKSPLDLNALSARVFKLTTTDKAIDKDQRRTISNLTQDAEWLEENSGPDTWMFDAEAGSVEVA